MTDTATEDAPTGAADRPENQTRLEAAIQAWAGGELRTPPRTIRGIRTRDAILTAAKHVFETQGYTEARVSDFVKAAKVSHGTFYNYFDNKREVFAELIRESVSSQLQETRVPPDYSADPVDRIEYTIRTYADLYLARGQMSVVINQVAALDEEFRKVRLMIRVEFRDRVERGIRRQQERGIADKDIDPRTAADVIVSMVSHYCLQHFGIEGSTEVDKAVETLTRFWTRSLGITRGTAA